MKKKSIFLIIGLVTIIVVSVIIGLIIKNMQKNKKETVVALANTSVEQRKVWNEFLNMNPYLSQINMDSYLKDVDLIKLAITSDNVEIENIVTEEIEERPLLSMGDGYKKSINNINEYLKSFLGVEEVAYNFVETYVEEDNYLIIGEEYVYFTKIELPEKIYIAINYKNENNKYEVEIYEYNVTESNKEILIKMLETGEIIGEIETSNKYVLTGQIENQNIKISSKKSL